MTLVASAHADVGGYLSAPKTLNNGALSQRVQDIAQKGRAVTTQVATVRNRINDQERRLIDKAGGAVETTPLARPLAVAAQNNTLPDSPAAVLPSSATATRQMVRTEGKSSAIVGEAGSPTSEGTGNGLVETIEQGSRAHWPSIVK